MDRCDFCFYLTTSGRAYRFWQSVIARVHGQSESQGKWLVRTPNQSGQQGQMVYADVYYGLLPHLCVLSQIRSTDASPLKRFSNKGKARLLNTLLALLQA